jgi:hypothetical protein
MLGALHSEVTATASRQKSAQYVSPNISFLANRNIIYARTVAEDYGKGRHVYVLGPDRHDAADSRRVYELS